MHFYGAKEVEYILRVTSPDVVVDGRALRAQRLPGHVLGRCWRWDRCPLWLVVGDTAPGKLPAAATAFAPMLGAEPIAAPADVDPESPAIIAFTSGTTRDPKGVVHSHRTIGCETRQLDYMFPRPAGHRRSPGAPVGHFIGMVNAFLIPLLRERPVHLIDVWDPAEVLRLMGEEGLGMSGGATYFLTSLLDHPDFTPEHLALMPFAGLGGLGRPRRRHRAGHASSASRCSARTAAPSTLRSRAASSTIPRRSA